MTELIRLRGEEEMTMTVTRYEPWELLNQLHGQINRIFDNQLSNGTATTAATADWVPPADIEEYVDRFVLKLDVPGVNISAIDITLENGVLAIGGTREQDAGENDCERARRERAYGRFHRRFTLPDTVEASSVKANGRNGVLEVVIPKQPKAQPRRIEVRAD
jgi:HSP20 family protein